MVFTVNDDTQQVIATIRNKGADDLYECKFMACNNPVCACRNMYLELVPIPGQAIGERTLSSRGIGIDMMDRKLEYKGELKTPHKDGRFAKAFFVGLAEEDFKFLDERWHQYKAAVSEKAEVGSINAVFDYDQVEQDGLMYAYNDVLPYAEQLQVTVDGKNCLILDQFCLLPKCSCTDATLSIVGIDASRVAEETLYTVRMNYKKKQWEDVEEDSGYSTSSQIKTVIEEQIPDFYKKVLSRHVRLKAIYADCKKRHSKTITPPEFPRVGRNDLCPCGSGKKYKKCCLGKINSPPDSPTAYIDNNAMKR